MAHESASRAGKMQTGGRCVFTGTTGVDGAHLFAAGGFPQLADVPENIFAMNRNHHSVSGKPCFDKKIVNGVEIDRDVDERIYLLMNYTLDELRASMSRKLRILEMHCEKFGINYPPPKRPGDLEELLYQRRVC